MKIKILGRDFTVKQRDRRESGTLGTCAPEDGIITVADHIANDQQAQVLLHELIEAVNALILNEEMLSESQIVGLSQGLFAVFMDNDLSLKGIAAKGIQYKL